VTPSRWDRLKNNQPALAAVFLLPTLLVLVSVVVTDLDGAVADAAAHLYVWALKDIPQDLRDALADATTGAGHDRDAIGQALHLDHAGPPGRRPRAPTRACVMVW